MASSTHRYRRGAAVLAVVLCLLCACGPTAHPGGQAGDGRTGPTPDAPATALPPTGSPTPVEPTGDPGPTGPSEDTDRLDAAVADLAAHLGVGAEEVTVVSHEDVTWPDGALGCPQPGMAYTQALVPGSRLVLAAGGVEYQYHGASDGPLVRCDRAPLSQPDRGTD